VGEKPTGEEMAFSTQHRLFAIDVEVALETGRKNDLALLVGKVLEKLEKTASATLEKFATAHATVLTTTSGRWGGLLPGKKPPRLKEKAPRRGLYPQRDGENPTAKA
jgi:hypothetical protein